MKRLFLIIIPLLILVSVAISCGGTKPAVAPAPAPAPDVKELEVHFSDVGQGDAILIDWNDTEVLIDGGDRSPGIVAYLNKHIDGALEAMIATNPYADHIGGLIEVLAEFEVKEIWHSLDKTTSETYSDFISAVNAENAEVTVAIRGDTIKIDDLTFESLNLMDMKFNVNNNSIVLHLAFGEIDFLFMSDVEKEAEAAMLVKSDIAIPDVEIIKVGYHGSMRASSPDFLAMTSPEIAIYMAGEGNEYGHPHEEAIQALSEAGAEIYGTDIYGTIIVTTSGEKYNLKLEKQNLPVTLPAISQAPLQRPELPKARNTRITNIFYKGEVPRIESDEYVEITNMGRKPVDLSGCMLKDISEGYPVFIFPPHILQPEESIRVYTNEIHPKYGGFSFGYEEAIWNNYGPDTVVLYDAKRQEVSRISYED